MLTVRRYQPGDYPQLKVLYESPANGGQFDEARDAEMVLRRKSEEDPDSVLVADDDGSVVGSVSLIEDGRVAWLFRFVVTDGPQSPQASEMLCEKAMEILHSRGHQQVLVYAPKNDPLFESRYRALGFQKGNDYTCYWK